MLISCSTATFLFLPAAPWPVDDQDPCRAHSAGDALLPHKAPPPPVDLDGGRCSSRRPSAKYESGVFQCEAHPRNQYSASSRPQSPNFATSMSVSGSATNGSQLFAIASRAIVTPSFQSPIRWRLAMPNATVPEGDRPPADGRGVCASGRDGVVWPRNGMPVVPVSGGSNSHNSGQT